MPNLLLNLCFEAPAGGTNVTLQGHAGDEAPAVEPPYFFQVFYTVSDVGTPIEGDVVELASSAYCRVVAWDAEPLSPPEKELFLEPTSIALGVKVTVTGDPSLVSAGPRDPWPPT